ncbi:VOC family protein [uncultured Leifsonia sp.]|uniref:VOC family protein n=1 Tax=Leifsonia sp. TaxID=1870902 RepID=UPI0028D2E5D2|nr:VOC family protein [uncultured Leifsonia sp.]
MTLSLQYSHITVTDPEAALAFYRDALGLDVLNDVASGGHHWITLGAAGGGTQIVLSDPYAGRSQSDGDSIQELVTKGVLTNVVFNTEDDLDEVFERVRASGAEVLQEPKDQPWGPRDCAFRDPSGNMVRILQSTQQPQEA